MRVRSVLFAGGAGVVALLAIGAVAPGPVRLPVAGSSVVFEADGLRDGCAEVLPVSRASEGLASSSGNAPVVVVLGRSVGVSDASKGFPVVAWWFDSNDVVVQVAHLRPFAGRVEVPLPALKSVGVVELGPSQWPGFDAGRVWFGPSCVPGRA